MLRVGNRVADAINGDNDAGALVDVVATPATAESDAEAVGLYLEGGEIIVPPLEENANARFINVEGGWIYPVTERLFALRRSLICA